MWPLGSYDRMVHEIKRRENRDIPVTFGILIADYRQQANREYILNYIKRFNYKSGKYINFYLPGYLEENNSRSNDKIIVNNKEYYFNEDVYEQFLEKLEADFEIDYPYTPVLLLIEYNKGHFNMSNRISIKLHTEAMDIKKTGDLFEKIFSIAQKEVSLKEIKSDLRKETLKSGLLYTIVKAIDKSYITAIYEHGKSVKEFIFV